MSKRFVTLFLAASFAGLTLSTTAIGAAPGGGGGSPGGSGGGGFSGPSYNPAADYQLGVQALKDGKYKEADKAFDKVLNAVPSDPVVLLLYGLSKAGQNDLKGARKAYERSVRADKKNIDAHRELGVTYAKLGEAPKAADELKTLQARVDACGDVCPEAGALKAAVAAVQGAIAAPKGSAELAHPGLMFADAKQGDNAYLQAVGLINQGRYRDALGSLEVARTAFGPHPDVLTYVGFTYRKMGEYDQAEKYYTEALKVAPDHKAATEYFGELKVERGDLPGARKLLARLNDICVYGCAEEQELRRWIDAAQKTS